MASDTTGQSIPDDPHRPDGPRMPPPSSSVEYRKCLKCSKAKPLQDFKSQRKARSYAQDAMNGPIDTDMNEELMTAKIDSDEDLSDASSEDLYGADDYCDEASATRRARGSASGGSPKAKAWEFPSYLPIPE
ncbi:hypothetical protein E4U22_007928 [Claviceps purpurea]|nr:hypothetical protein E4U22_007928 [Claviceps purpurea]